MLKSNMRFILIVILMIFALSVTGSACSEEPITFGTLEGSVYENEYLGIGCQLDGWHYYDKDELQETNAMSLADLPADMREIVKRQNGMILMFAESPDRIMNVNIAISYKPGAEADAAHIGMKNIVAANNVAMKEALQQTGKQVVYLDNDSTSIGSEVFYGYTVCYSNNGHVMGNRSAMFAKEDYVITVTSTGDTLEQVTDIFTHFYLLKDKKQRTDMVTAETNTAEPLVSDIVSMDELETNQFMLSAIGGDVSAQYEVGWRYENGIGIIQDYAEAMSWYRKAADQGDTNAQNQIGWLYQNGLGVEQDFAEAFRWYSIAAENGNASAQNNIGYAYANGQGVGQDFEEALKWYMKAVEQGNDAAQNNIGYAYANGQGVEQNFEEAFKWYMKAAEQGNVTAQSNLGYAYDIGQGVEQNSEEAFKWYMKAAEQGDVTAQNNIGYAYANGQGVEQDYEEAFKWYKKAAEQGNAVAQSNLGDCYIDGTGVEKDDVQGFNWYMKAAEQGNRIAISNIGWCYENGVGVEKDLAEAQRWYDKAK